MKKGFTLLELIIVIIILGVLATLGFTRYGAMIERARGAEAKTIIGDIRKFAAGYYLEYGNVSAITDSAVNIGTANEQVPENCRSSYYFEYNITGISASVANITAKRCGTDGKVPAGNTSNQIMLNSNFTSGNDTWSITGGY